MKGLVLPVGYAEVQRVIPPEGSPDRGLEIDRALKDMLSEAVRNAGRSMELYASRIEVVGHNTLLYAGFVPLLEPGQTPTPPLDPSNLNAAEKRVLGQLVRDDASIGYKEQRFGQGVPVATDALAPTPSTGAVPIKSS
jgi:hypothetical protein